MAFTTQRGEFPRTRMRRLRANEFSRQLVRESLLSPADFIFPVFILEGSGQREAISSMPGIERLSIDLLVAQAREIRQMGIPAIALFPVVGSDQKSLRADEAFNPDGLVQRAVRALKEAVPELIQNNLNVKNLNAHLNNILVGAEREDQLENYQILKQKLGAGGAAERTATAIVHSLKSSK